MIASYIGKIFLQEYNKIDGKNYSVKDFFIKEFIPLFFDHPKYLMKAGNAPLDNPKIRVGTFPDKAERAVRIQKTLEKIENSPEESSPVGYPSNDVLATTSGQVTNLDLQINPENVYLSWIGGALGIGVKGGLAIMFDHPKILMDLYRGWSLYRKIINEVDQFKGNQIETWNGQWLAHLYSYHFEKNEPTANFDFSEAKQNIIQIKTQSWVKVLFGITRNYSDLYLTGYVYSLGQTNKTIGFIPFILTQITRPLQLYKKLYGENQFLDNINIIENVYGTASSLQRSCEKGCIGISALEPKELRNYMPGSYYQNKFPDYKKADELQIISFNTYITWVIAMLNNEELLQKADEAAKIFIQYESGGKASKTDRPNKIKKVLEVTNKRKFIDELIPVLSVSDGNVEPLNELVEEINKMPSDGFPYFITLIRFKYSYNKKS